MGEGAVQEMGKHDELLRNENGLYAHLVAAQRLRETRDVIDLDDVIGQSPGVPVEGPTDIEKAALILLTDYRDGLLGRISLETPQTRAAMLAAAVKTPKIIEERSDDEE